MIQKHLLLYLATCLRLGGPLSDYQEALGQLSSLPKRGCFILGVDANCTITADPDDRNTLFSEVMGMMGLDVLEQPDWTHRGQHRNRIIDYIGISSSHSGRSKCRVITSMHSRSDHRPVAMTLQPGGEKVLTFQRGVPSLRGWSASRDAKANYASLLPQEAVSGAMRCAERLRML